LGVVASQVTGQREEGFARTRNKKNKRRIPTETGKYLYFLKNRSWLKGVFYTISSLRQQGHTYFHFQEQN
jgi:hypothetical protein